ncbi:MAG TPA: hypothetical protein VJM11_06805 [Nevskiaceae bacterium]|nr:hypothetical protein [Nevskiaceae bacterium]
MNRAPLDAAFGFTLMVAGAMIALPEKLKARSSPAAEVEFAAMVAPSQEQLHRCEEAKLAAIHALKRSDLDGYRVWEQASRRTCRAAGF